jgi:MerR family transcriptional regulator, redox-sensitive transcriptional activator SoxR
MVVGWDDRDRHRMPCHRTRRALRESCRVHPDDGAVGPDPTLTRTARLGGQRRYDGAVLARLEVIRLCKPAGFALEEIQLLFADDAPGRPASRALAETKLAEIDAQMASLARARAVVEWGMRCTCPSIDACTWGIHSALPA